MCEEKGVGEPELSNSQKYICVLGMTQDTGTRCQMKKDLNTASNIDLSRSFWQYFFALWSSVLIASFTLLSQNYPQNWLRYFQED